MGRYVVCDLQGGRYSDEYVLTDPALLTVHEELQELDQFEEDTSALRTMHTEQVRGNVKAMLEDFKYGKNITVAVLSAER